MQACDAHAPVDPARSWGHVSADRHVPCGCLHQVRIPHLRAAIAHTSVTLKAGNVWICLESCSEAYPCSDRLLTRYNGSDACAGLQRGVSASSLRLCRPWALTMITCQPPLASRLQSKPPTSLSSRSPDTPRHTRCSPLLLTQNRSL